MNVILCPSGKMQRLYPPLFPLKFHPDTGKKRESEALACFPANSDLYTMGTLLHLQAPPPPLCLRTLRRHLLGEANRTPSLPMWGFPRHSRSRRSVRIFVASATETHEEEEALKKGIAEFYDESSMLWEGVWGEHMHHGFYDTDAAVTIDDHRVAQIRMIEEALRFAGVSDNPLKKPKEVLDVGCGIGGSSRYIAKKYGAYCQGITLSPVQAQRAQALAIAEGLADQVHFQVADALDQPFSDGQFDLVWSMESGEHMPDKMKFVSELARVAAPGAAIIIVTWCHRDLLESEESLLPEETNLLNKICNAYYLPSWCSAAEYVKIAKYLSLEEIKTADWSDNVAPFWPAVVQSAFTWGGLTSLLRSGWKAIKGALVMPLMIEGYKKKLIKFVIITCRKPA